MQKEVIGNAELYCADCAVILPQLAPVDLILTDPPYGLGSKTFFTEKRKTKVRKTQTAAAYKKDYGIQEWDNRPPPSWVFGLMSDKSTYQIIFGGNFFALPAAMCCLIWDKENGNTTFADCEIAWTNLDKATRLKRFMWNGMLQGDMKNKEERLHPAQKPICIMEWCISQAPDDVQSICDPFMGSGTVGVAAMNMQKQFIGIEQEPKYFDIACRRIEDAQKQMPLFDAV